MNYYLITGLENGEPITPFIVESETIPHSYLNCYGDMARYYEPITKEEVIRLVKEERLEVF